MVAFVWDLDLFQSLKVRKKSGKLKRYWIMVWSKGRKNIIALGGHSEDETSWELENTLELLLKFVADHPEFARSI